MPLRGRFGQIAAVLLERLELVLGVLVGDPVAAANLRERLQQLSRESRRASAARRRRGPGWADSARIRCSVETYSSLELAHLVLGGAHDLASSSPEPPVASAAALVSRGSASSAGAERGADGGRVDAELAQHGRDHAGVLLEQHREQVLRACLRVVALLGQPLGGLQRLLGLDREAICVAYGDLP